MTEEEWDTDAQYEAMALRALDLCLDMTRNNRLDWKSRADRDHAYEVDLPSANVEVGTEDNDGAAPHDLRIYGPAPEYGLVYTLSGRDVPEVQEKIMQLWKLVERKLRNVDGILGALLKDLGAES